MTFKCLLRYNYKKSKQHCTLITKKLSFHILVINTNNNNHIKQGYRRLSIYNKFLPCSTFVHWRSFHFQSFSQQSIAKNIQNVTMDAQHACVRENSLRVRKNKMAALSLWDLWKTSFKVTLFLKVPNKVVVAVVTNLFRSLFDAPFWQRQYSVVKLKEYGSKSDSWFSRDSRRWVIV